MKKQIIQNYLAALKIKELSSLEHINELIQAHLEAYAFSSVKVLLKEEISLELESIYDSLIVKKRGGYCFEHNKLMYETLKLHGFDVKFYLARVINNVEGQEPQTHRFTLLSYQGEDYIIDVGIGFRSPTCAIKFSQQKTQTPQGKTYWVESFDQNMYGLICLESDQAFRITKFDLKFCTEGDFEMGHFYSHQYPTAVFVTNLVLSRIIKDEIRSLRNGSYFILKANSHKEIKIEDATHLLEIITHDFNCTVLEEEADFLYQTYCK